MRIACLSGWGQPHDALEAVVPGATHIDYARHDSASAALLNIGAQAREHDVVIGWSLGGQLAVRAIAAGLLRPRALVLIATPFQFVKNAQTPIGMPAGTFATFRANYERKPLATLAKAWELIAMDDDNGESIREKLARQDKESVLRGHWLPWLDILAQYSCEGLYLENAPPTLIIHGDKDLVVYPEQAGNFLLMLPSAQLQMLPGCGHAPHWHDTEKLRALIGSHIHTQVLECPPHG